LPRHKRKTPPTLADDIGFGRVHTDHMLVCDFLPNKGGWQPLEILPYGPFELSPDAVVFHYGQQIFEGMKAYRSPQSNTEVALFRPELNARRFFNSARRLGMEPVPEDLFLQAVREIVSVESDWILPTPGALYIRPALIPLDEGVSYRASTSYRFFVILSPSKNYYANETSVTVAVERGDIRAVPGGVGEAKCGGNYAGALPALARARKLGAEQVLWLDGLERRYVEEVGAMNVMFVYEDRIETPSLSGSILPGVTRHSVIELARHLGMHVVEKRVEIDRVLADAGTGALREAFGCGTAAVISPIDAFLDGEKRIAINNGEIGATSVLLKKTLVDIQTGATPDPFRWRVAVPCAAL
jgi:branched-chain amino acid aminotransferase